MIKHTLICDSCKMESEAFKPVLELEDNNFFLTFTVETKHTSNQKQDRAEICSACTRDLLFHMNKLLRC